MQEQERREYEVKIKSLQEELQTVQKRSRKQMKQIRELTIAREKNCLKRFPMDIIVKRGWLDSIPLGRWKGDFK